MKKLVTSVFFTLLFINNYAQNLLKPNEHVSEESFAQWLSGELKLKANETFIPYRTEKDKNGYTHTRLQLHYNGIAVEGAVFIAHFYNGKLQTANGFYNQAFSYNSPVPVISEKEATALAYVKAEKYKQEPEGKLVYFSTNKKDFTLAYKTDVYALKPLKRLYVYVDASAGKIIAERNRIHHVTGTAVTKYSGTQTIVTDSFAGNYRLRDAGRSVETYNMQNGYDVYSAVDFTDADNYWNNVNAYQDEIATDAHWGAEMTYDFFYDSLGRDSYDNAGATVLSYVHYDYLFANAFWDGTSMTYGDGDSIEYGPFTTVDVVGHEFGHGVTEYSAGLDYYSESGALNESFSDIFGTVIEFYAKPSTANFLMGEEMSLTGAAIRSMENPNLYDCPDTYMGTFWDPYEEVHTNSGVQNFWFYLLCMGGTGTNDNGDAYSVTGIGISKATQIAYRTLAFYLTPYSNYSDARTYSTQAASDLYGACSAEVSAVENAWYAVGVGGVPSTLTSANFSANTTFSCSLPVTVNFTNLSANANVFMWNFGDGGTSTLQNPSHTYTTAGTFTVQLIASGSGPCGSGSDTLVKTSYITVSNNNGPIPASCTPTTIDTSYGFGIYNVTFNTIDNTTQPDDGYQDYTCQFQTNVIIGNNYSISVETNAWYEEDVMIWIDYNNDGSFSGSSENVFSDTYLIQYHSGNISIPTNAVINTPLRMRIGTEYSWYGPPSPCTNTQYGQFEDYTITVFPDNAPPVANYNFYVSNICEGTVQFSDLSLNNPTSWYWDFGDSGSAALANPSHSYANAGTYTVTLTATNAFGSDIFSQTVTVNPFVADFIAPDTAFTGNTVTFTDNSPNAVSWQWNFGDGYGAALQNPSHIFMNEGIFIVQLTANNNTGCSDQITKAIVVVRALSVEEYENSDLIVYPNPNDGKFKIQNEKGKIQSVEIYNALGQQIVSLPSIGGEGWGGAVDLFHLPNGVYFLQLQTDSSVIIRKIIIGQ